MPNRNRKCLVANADTKSRTPLGLNTKTMKANFAVKRIFKDCVKISSSFKFKFGCSVQGGFHAENASLFDFMKNTLSNNPTCLIMQVQCAFYQLSEYFRQ